MNDTYFSGHYAGMNRIDPASERSVQDWLARSLEHYEREIGVHCGTIADRSVLDIGCGIGGTLHYFRQHGAAKVTGVDRSEEQLGICRRFVTDQVVHADALDFLSTHSEQYDLITALDLIEHLPKDRIIEFCTLLRSRVRAGGRIVLKTPNMGHLFGLRSRYIDFTHETGFTEESIRQVLFNAGFTRIRISNAYIGRKRAKAVRLFQRGLELLYNVQLSGIVTPNLIVVAEP